MTTFGQIPSNDELITGTNVTLGGLNLASLYPDPGVDKPASLKVTQRGAGVNMSVDVAAGSAYVPDGSNGINLISKAAVTNLAVSNGDAGGIRHDFVTIDSDGTLAVLEGTVGSDPTPASNTHVLARIRVPQNESTSIDDADIDDKREYGTVWRNAKGIIGESTYTSGGTTVNGDTVIHTLNVTEEADRQYRGIGTGAAYGNAGTARPEIALQRSGATKQRALTGSQGNVQSTRSHLHRLITPIQTATSSGTVAWRILAGKGSFDSWTFYGNSTEPSIITVEDMGGLDKPSGSEGQ